MTRTMSEWVSHLHPVLQALIRVVLYVIPVLLFVVPIIWWERRFLGWMQDRFGPNRTGNISWSRTSKYVPSFLRGKKWKLFGLAQPLADGLKLFFKEDITPTAIDRALYFIAPAVALFPAFTLGATIPWGPFPVFTPVADVNIGVLYIMAISSLGVYGVVLSGYSSNNKYSLMGGLRASAQLVSYELAMGMALASIVMATGSLKMSDMIAAQQQPLWGFFPALANWFILTPYGMVAGVVFLICMVAETNRAPFDLPEAENELVAGYHTEYSSMKFAVFFMGEYAAMFTWSLIFGTIFLGGYNLLPVPFHYLAENYPSTSGIWNALDFINGNSWLAPLWIILKGFLGICFYVWLRATMPRLRYDQLMSLGWKTLLPLATANLIVVALWILLLRVYPDQPYIALLSILVAAAILVRLYQGIVQRVGPSKEMRHFERRQVRLVDVPAPRPAATVAAEGEAS